MRQGDHFETVAASYAAARLPYPVVLYDTLEAYGVAGHDQRILEVGAGSGEATGELARRGCEVVAVEPGQELAARLQRTCPTATVMEARIEDVDLPTGRFDSVVAATSLHWVDLPVALPRLARLLKSDGWLAVWRTVFGDPRVQTPFRRSVDHIVAMRGESASRSDRLEPRPTAIELEAGDCFRLVRSWQWPWQIDLTATQLRALFATFSDWQDQDELNAVQAAATALGGTVTEHYVTVLHLLRKSAGPAGG